MNNNNTIFVENNEIDKHKKYLEYRKEWVKNNKDKVNAYARAQYLKNLTINGDEYRNKLNLKNKKTRQLKKEQRILENPDLVIKIGRPSKLIIENIEAIIKKSDVLVNIIFKLYYMIYFLIYHKININ